MSLQVTISRSVVLQKSTYALVVNNRDTGRPLVLGLVSTAKKTGTEEALAPSLEGLTQHAFNVGR